MVEPQIVVLVVAGSSPVGHPWFLDFRVPIFDLEAKIDNFCVQSKFEIENRKSHSACSSTG
jgi:hypothetical protein